MFKKQMISLLPIFFLFFTNCCSTANLDSNENRFYIKEQSTFGKIKKSIVKIDVDAKIGIADKVISSISQTTEEKISSSGSGSIIGHVNGGTLILTAAHVCQLDLNQILFVFPYYKEKQHSLKISYLHQVIDYEGVAHKGYILAISQKSDTCVLLTEYIDYPSIPLAANPVEEFEKVYSINFPRGIWQAKLSPTLEGHFIGYLKVADRNVLAFSMRSAPGSSGGIIINTNGEAVSLIYAYLASFDEFTLGASMGEIREILDNSYYIFSSRTEYYNNLLKNN